MREEERLPSEEAVEALRVGAQLLLPGGDESALLIIPRGMKVKLEAYVSERDVDYPGKKPAYENEVLAQDVYWPRLDDLHGILHFAHFVQHPGKEPPPIEVLGISLKEIQVFAAMSEETIAFSAKLYLDGELVGHVKNQGTGGSNIYLPATVGWVAPLRKAQKRAEESGCPFEPLDSIINICILGGRSLKELSP